MSSAELKQRYQELESELIKVEQDALIALEALKAKSDVKVKLGNWKQKKETLKTELKLVESDLLQAEIPELKSVYTQAKRDLKRLESQRQIIAAEWRKKIDEVTEIEHKHRAIDFRCYGLDQTILEMVDQISEKRNRLSEIIREMIAPVEPEVPTIRSNKN